MEQVFQKFKLVLAFLTICDQLARHSLMDIALKAEGDLHIDTHHTVEDCGWAVGSAFAEAIGDRSGICRYDSFYLPMDEAMSRVAVDVSGRPFLIWNVQLTSPKIGEMDTEVFVNFSKHSVRPLALPFMSKRFMARIAITIGLVSKHSPGRCVLQQRLTRVKQAACRPLKVFWAEASSSTGV